MIPVAIFKSLFGISSFDVHHHDQVTIITRKHQQNIRMNEITTTTYAKFKGVSCRCGCDWMVRVNVSFVAVPGATTWSFKCRKCGKTPMSGMFERLFREAAFKRKAIQETAKV